MQKGFGFYSPHETTVLFLKAALVSIWIGLDLVVLFIVYGMQRNAVDQHIFAVSAAAIVLAAGTIFSLLFVWATGALFGHAGPEGDAKRFGGRAAELIATLKSKPYHLLGTGLAGVVVALSILAPVLFGSLFSGDGDQPFGRANLAVVKKCTEVAQLERSLFRSDERTVMAQCILQYDRTYAALHTD